MILIAVLITALFAQQPPAASVAGTVVQIGSLQPIPNAVVELQGDGAKTPSIMPAGADGKFEFRNLAPGRYRLKVSRNGYLENSRGRSIFVSAGQILKDIRIAMIPLGAISGRIYDSAGEPVVNVSVRALKYSYEDGRRILTTVKTDTTDDRGEFRLFWLTPGRYFVSAMPQGKPGNEMHVMNIMGSRVQLDADGIPQTGAGYAIEKFGERYVPVYYPGSTEPASATPVDVQPGSDFTGIHFSLPRVMPRKVRGIAVDGRTGQAARNASVILVSRSGSTLGTVAARPTPDGTFEFQSVFPGEYYAVASARIDAGGGAAVRVGGRTAVDVGSSDVDRLVVVMSPTKDIEGNITFDGIPDASVKSHHPIVALRHELPAAALSQLYASFSSTTRFVVNDAFEGDYRVEVTDLAPGTYLKSIRFGAAELPDAILPLDPRSTDRLEILLGTNVGVVEGVVIDKDGRPVPDAVVAVAADGPRRGRLDLYKSASTDAAGRFRIESIAPGDYRAFAWEEIEERRWMDPDFILRNEATGRRVHVGERSRETLELVAIPFAY